MEMVNMAGEKIERSDLIFGYPTIYFFTSVDDRALRKPLEKFIPSWLIS